MNKYQLINDWLKNYEPLLDVWIDFNAVNNSKEGAVSLNSVPSERIIAKYIDGTTRREVLFMVAMMKFYDSGTSLTNMENLQEVENFAEWIEANKSLLNFGDNSTIEAVDVLTNYPELAGVDTDNSIAKYQFQVRITYQTTKEEE